MILFQHLIPQHALSRFMGKLANCRWRWFKNLFIKIFIKIYQVDMKDALDPNPENYPDFNNFFTRALRPEARPIVQGEKDIACPVDGYVGQIGSIEEGKIFQAKKFYYNATELLGGYQDLGQQFQQGNFVTLYLAPHNYHRVHMPITGTLQEMIHVPGKLFSVNPHTVDCVSNLFARNERVISIFETKTGPMALILVGAMIVASIETVWAGKVTPPPQREIRNWDYRHQQIILSKGEEMGRFKMGSTVIVLFSKDRVTWEHQLHIEDAVKLGQLLGNI
jgi:phosphatidylserine decarboxylase